MKKAICSVILGFLLLITGLMCTSPIEVHATSVNDMDYNENNLIDILDLSSLSTNYKLVSSDSGWNSKYDLNVDNIIDIYDIVLISKAIGTKITPIPILSDNTDITSKFTDTTFKNKVYNLIGKTSPEVIFYKDVKSIKALYLSEARISNLSGVEYFTALTSLECSNNILTNLDVSKNTLLIFLECDGNQLTSLDVSKNTVLAWLDCYKNKLTSLDVSNNSSLAWLDCRDNQLTILNVSGCLELDTLDCSSNQLASIDVSKNTALTMLYCYENQLTSLDVSKNTALIQFSCISNQLITLYSFKIWDNWEYKLQYIDASHTNYIENLMITIKT